MNLLDHYPGITRDDFIKDVETIRIFRQLFRPLSDKDSIKNHNAWASFSQAIELGFRPDSVRVKLVKKRCPPHYVNLGYLANSHLLLFEQVIGTPFYSDGGLSLRRKPMRKIRNIQSLRTEAVRIFCTPKGDATRARILLKMLKKKELVYDYVTEVLRTAIPDLLKGDREVTRKLVSNHLKFS